MATDALDHQAASLREEDTFQAEEVIACGGREVLPVGQGRTGWKGFWGVPHRVVGGTMWKQNRAKCSDGTSLKNCIGWGHLPVQFDECKVESSSNCKVLDESTCVLELTLNLRSLMNQLIRSISLRDFKSSLEMARHILKPA